MWLTLPTERLYPDESPAAVAEGPSLQIWVGPRIPQDEVMEDAEDGISIEGSCSINEPMGTLGSSASSQMLDSSTTQGSTIGGFKRKLLNSTTNFCGNATAPIVYNLATNDYP